MSDSNRNSGLEYDESLIQNVKVNMPQVTKVSNQVANSKQFDQLTEAAWLLRAVTVIDLTTLSGDDSVSNVERLCCKAKHPLAQSILDRLKADHGFDAHEIRTAAVCVYPYQVPTVYKCLQRLGVRDTIQIAAVATGFPSGQYALESRLAEVRQAVADGATEIDIVINRTLALQGKWREIYDEVRAMREACGPAHLKTILGTGELGSLSSVYRASLVCCMAGADFIKTSTGKEAVNATYPVAYVMARAIRDYHRMTGVKVGFKPAGGIRTGAEAVSWLVLMKEVLGDDWTRSDLFRFGASSLLADIEARLFKWTHGVAPGPCDLPLP